MHTGANGGASLCRERSIYSTQLLTICPMKCYACQPPRRLLREICGARGDQDEEVEHEGGQDNEEQDGGPGEDDAEDGVGEEETHEEKRRWLCA